MKETCLYCKKKVPEGFKVCPNCATPVGKDKPYIAADRPKKDYKAAAQSEPVNQPAPGSVPVPAPEDISLHLHCTACNSEKVNVQAVAETEKRGCITAGWYALLIALPFIGWAVLIMLLFGQESNTVSYCVCQNCGKIWKA